MKTVTLDGTAIRDESSFHAECQRVFGFPEFYGGNMSAWVDCMRYLDDPDACMSKVWVEPGEILILDIKRASDFKTGAPNVWLALLECVAFVNWRRVERGEKPILTVSAYA
jgi:RNAse (barnase) inhibitor barstar